MFHIPNPMNVFFVVVNSVDGFLFILGFSAVYEKTSESFDITFSQTSICLQKCPFLNPLHAIRVLMN